MDSSWRNKSNRSCRQTTGKHVSFMARLQTLAKFLPRTSTRYVRVLDLLDDFRRDAKRLKRAPPLAGDLSCVGLIDNIGRKMKPHGYKRKAMKHYRDAFSVDDARQMTPEQVDELQAYILDRKTELQDLYNQRAPSYLNLEDDIVAEMFAAYDRRIMEMEWRRPGSKLRQEFITGDEFEAAVRKFSEDAYGDERACGKVNVVRRMQELKQQMEKLFDLREKHRGVFLGDVISDPTYRPAALLNAMQEKVDDFEEQLQKLRQQEQDYEEAVAQFSEDAYGRETAVRKHEMGRRRKDLLTKINQLALLQESMRGEFPDDVISDPANRPAALLDAMKKKVEDYELMEKAYKTRSQCDVNKYQPSTSNLGLKNRIDSRGKWALYDAIDRSRSANYEGAQSVNSRRESTRNEPSHTLSRERRGNTYQPSASNLDLKKTLTSRRKGPLYDPYSGLALSRYSINEGDLSANSSRQSTLHEPSHTLSRERRVRPLHEKYDDRAESCEHIKERQDVERNMDTLVRLKKELQNCYDIHTAKTLRRVINDEALPTRCTAEEFDETVFHDVVLPGDLLKKFTCAASGYSARGLECCGFLFGHAMSSIGKLIVTNLFIPDQRVSPINCEATEESRYQDYVFELEFVLLGWIHTHPGHDNFLSNTDMKTQFSYQSSLREAVAIVCSDLDNVKKNRIYTLTQYGMAQWDKEAKRKDYQSYMIPRRHRLYKLAEFVVFNRDLKVEVFDERWRCGDDILLSR